MTDLQRKPKQISLDELEASTRLREQDAEICQILSQCGDAPFGFEKAWARQILSGRDVGSNWTERSGSGSSKRMLHELTQRPCAVRAVQRVWERPFDQETFLEDTLQLASALSGEPVQLRERDAGSVNPATGRLTARYPSPDEVRRQVPLLASLCARPCCARPVVSALLLWVFFFRLHPLPDGNGRTARALINLALRNFGIIEKPALFLSPGLFLNMQEIGAFVRSGNHIGDVAGLAAMLELCRSTALRCAR
ncbi:Fic family protein [Henriciella aquimarina]|uniref:Fic family protein n=1 Tax=Henriciella aquimarina TaxID=545261 RepID=UPI00117A1BC8|nr:Fic family protein [Henriciella aquimarina]